MVEAAEPLWTDIAQVVLVALQLVFLAVAAVVGLRQVREARQLREEQTRPFVLIDFEVEGPLLFLAVSNIGTTLARNVQFEIDPPLESSMDVTVSDFKMFGEGIATLPPNKVIRTLFDSAIQRKPLNLPDVYNVAVEYTDATGKRSFTEIIDLDLGIYWNLLRVDRHGLHDIHKRLKDIHGEMKKWSAGVGGGLLVLSPAENREETDHASERGKSIALNKERRTNPVRWMPDCQKPS